MNSKANTWFTRTLWIVAGCIIFLAGCGGEDSRQQTITQPVIAEPDIPVPDFVADSAYVYIEKQLSFGPRVPNTGSHVACANWLVKKLEDFGATVTLQPAVVQAFNGDQLNMQNIIASFSPEKERRVMLSAHWDTRPFADEDTARQNEPIPGANDGGSGVGVLLEIARLMGQNEPTVGIDIALWDAEDYGSSNVPNSYCLGSQFWAKNKHKQGYKALYGINLDMVGAENALFPKEGNSMRYAPNAVEKVWRNAQILGYGRYFSLQRTDGIIDDHLYVSSIGGVGMIDIIDQPNGQGFFEHWHTHGDDLETISRETLKAVGQTLLAVIYREK